MMSGFAMFVLGFINAMALNHAGVGIDTLTYWVSVVCICLAYIVGASRRD